MVVVHVKLLKGVNKVRLQQNPINTRYNSEIDITRCVVSWSLKNIRYNENDKIVIDGTSTQIPKGYYTFSDLKTALKKHGISIEKQLDNRVSLESDKDLDLNVFGELLGFDRDKKITKSTSYTSVKPASMTNGLRDIHIYCNLVDSSKNYSYVLSTNLYFSSNFFMMIPIDTTQTLNGNFTSYDVHGQRLPCRSDYRFQEIEFIVESGGHIDDYEVFLSFRLV